MPIIPAAPACSLFHDQGWGDWSLAVGVNRGGHQHISSKLQSNQTAYPIGSEVLQLETAALHHQLLLLLHGAGCLLSAQHVL